MRCLDTYFVSRAFIFRTKPAGSSGGCAFGQHGLIKQDVCKISVLFFGAHFGQALHQIVLGIGFQNGFDLRNILTGLFENPFQIAADVELIGY